jgi:hypothetical protein
MIIDYAPKQWLRRDWYAADSTEPATWCDRCTRFLGLVFILAPAVIFWCEEYLRARN